MRGVRTTNARVKKKNEDLRRKTKKDARVNMKPGRKVEMIDLTKMQLNKET